VNYTIHTMDTRPDLLRKRGRVTDTAWPEFMLNDPVGDLYYGRTEPELLAYQFVFVEPPDTVIALGFTIPFYWDGTPAGLPSGWDGVIEAGMRDYTDGRAPNTLSALEASIHPERQGQGLSRAIIEQMRRIATAHGLGALVAPVRPNHKSRYPLTPIERYMAWTQPDGTPFDPWLRTHWRMGARFLRPAPESMRIPGTVAQWEGWTGMRFPDSGAYIVPGALSPVEIDVEADQGLYIEPNVWMLHPLDAPEPAAP
jgi:GNAT superfamily N-acetyltransferase